MYNAFFGLTSSPFAIAPDPQYLYMSGQHQDALAYLIYGIQGNGGFVMLTGDVGTGKTTLCRCMLEHLPDNTDVAFILNPTLNSRELLASICDELSIDYDPHQLSIKTLSDAIYRHLLQSHAAGRNTILVIDEAQNLSEDILEQMRLLTNLETSEKKLLQIIMFGQPELRQLINQPTLRQLAQRITARFHLGPLHAEDTSHYIEHRLNIAGYQPRAGLSSPIPAHLHPRIHQLSHGIPRLINILCDRALMGAYALNKPCLSVPMIEQAAQEVFGQVRPAPRTAGALVRPLSFTLAGIFGTLLVLKFFPQAAHDAGQFLQQLSNSNVVTNNSMAANSSVEDSSRQTHSTANALLVSDTAPAAITQDRDLRSDQTVMVLSSRAANTRTSQPTAPLIPDLQAETLTAQTAPDGIPSGAQEPLEQPRTQTLPQSAPQTMPQSVPADSEQAQTDHAAPQPILSQRAASQPAAPSAIHADRSEPLATETLAYQALLRRWSIDLKDGVEPCQFASQQGLRCLHQKTSLTALQKINRPALIRMIDGAGQTSSLALLEITDGVATVSDGITQRQMSVDSLNAQPLLDYTLLWRPPRGYQGFFKAGDAGPAVLWLNQQLSQLTPLFQSEQDPQFEPRLALYVKAFQHSQNLLQDGIVGPETVIHLNTLLADDVPVLIASRKR